VIRVDGKGFTRFCEANNIEKPNDLNLLNIMNSSARMTCVNFKDIVLSYGQSDEYSFVIHPKSTFFNRRSQKILSLVVSYFTSAFVLQWPRLESPPCFDARIICYPNLDVLIDYFRWRQADCHVNNLYNTTFWAFVKSGKTQKEAHDTLKGTTSAEKNKILFEQFAINYNNEPDIFKKGTVAVKPEFEPMHVDIFQKEFYLKYEFFQI